MGSDILQWQRMLSIYQFLCRKKGREYTVNEVRTALLQIGMELNIRNTQRDLADLAEAGYLTAVNSGKNLRYRVPKEQAIDFYGELTENDTFSFLLISRILHWMFGENIDMESLKKAVEGSSKKNIGLYGKDLYEHLSLKMSGLLEYVGEESVKTGKQEFLPVFIKGLLEQKKIQVEYCGTTDETPKKIILEPWALIVYKSALYILCPNRKVKSRWNTFKLSRFQSVKILHEDFEKKSDVLKKELERMKYTGTIWDSKNEQEENPVLIKLRFDWECHLLLQEHSFLPDMKIIEHKNEGWIEVRMKTPINKDLLAWIRRWGTSVKVIAPVELKDEMVSYGKWLVSG